MMKDKLGVVVALFAIVVLTSVSGCTTTSSHNQDYSGNAVSTGTGVGTLTIWPEEGSYGAEIYLDNTFRGKCTAFTCLSSFNLTDGYHILLIKKSGFTGINESIQIVPGEDVAIKVDLARRSAIGVYASKSGTDLVVTVSWGELVGIDHLKIQVESKSGAVLAQDSFVPKYEGEQYIVKGYRVGEPARVLVKSVYNDGDEIVVVDKYV